MVNVSGVHLSVVCQSVTAARRTGEQTSTDEPSQSVLSTAEGRRGGDMQQTGACYRNNPSCYANGKVTEACGDMEPKHSAPAQTTQSPYHLTTNTSTFSPGDHIQVILSGTPHFKGFLLQARDASSQGSASTTGSFNLTNPHRTQLLTCNNQQGSAVSHTSEKRLTEVVVVWNAPKDAPSEVQFFVTVLQHYNLFWVKLPGPIIYHHGVTPRPPQSTTTLPPFTSDSCGQSKSCLLDPAGCDPKDPHCFFLSMTTEGPNKTSVMFELSGPAEGYVSFALSWDAWMGNDDVYMCVKDGDRVSVSAAFFSGRTHPEDQTQAGLSSVSWRLADGTIQCRFSRPVKVANQEPGRYDLNQEYFLFLASGHAQYGKIWKHNQQPLVSVHRKCITGPSEVLTGSRGPTIMKVHGAGWQHAGVHPYLGCCVVALTLIQPITAVFRPRPDSHRRYLFNWAHWGLGSLTEILAVVAMFLGTHQSSLLLPQPWTTHVLIGYVTWLASFRFMLLIHKHLNIKKALGPDDIQEIHSNQSEPSSRGSFKKSLILAALALGNSGFLIALLSSIADI
nr:PREDICTED: ferric-chelate reductase 1-like [Paralichthys olivaceus]